MEHTLKTGSEATVAYVSFDVVPSHKGAAIHIESFVRALAQAQANKKTNRKVELVNRGRSGNGNDPRKLAQCKSHGIACGR